MEMPDLHRRILDASLDVCHLHGLVLAGGYAMRAHGLVDRPSQDLDFATFASAPLAEATEALAAAYQAAGFEVESTRDSPTLARLVVSDPETDQSCAVDLMKMPLQRPPVTMEFGPVACIDDMVGMKVGAVHGRGLPRDLIDVASVADHYSFIELERLGSLFEADFRLVEVHANLELAIVLDSTQYTALGLDDDAVARVRRFMLAWYDDLAMRLAEEEHLRAGPLVGGTEGYPAPAT